MSYRSILVHMDPSPDALHRLRLANDLAKRFGAHLIGLSGGEVEAMSVANAAAPAAYLADCETEIRDACASLGDAFFDSTQGTDAEWRAFLHTPADLLERHARAADLVVIGRAEAGVAGPQFHLSPAEAVMRAGRPVLVVPEDVDSLAAENILVAWKTGREASLAVQLAMPLLKAAKQVTVLGVGSETSQGELDDVRDYLKRHGIAAETHWRGLIGLSIDRAIVEAAGRAHADLIVSGAYGTPRPVEWVFGGATRGLIGKSPFCCLMAH